MYIIIIMTMDGVKKAEKGVPHCPSVHFYYCCTHSCRIVNNKCLHYVNLLWIFVVAADVC